MTKSEAIALRAGQAAAATGILPILVGEANPYGSHPDFALYPDPPYSAGGRLCRLILKMDEETYLRSFERVNLCPSKWSMPVARERAEELWRRARDGGTVVLFGSKVCGAFGLTFTPFSTKPHGTGKLVLLPHPSGLNRMWGEPGAYERARATLAEAGIRSGE